MEQGSRLQNDPNHQRRKVGKGSRLPASSDDSLIKPDTNYFPRFLVVWIRGWIETQKHRRFPKMVDAPSHRFQSEIIGL